MRWLAQVHSYGHESTAAAYALDLAYDLLLASPRWLRHNGADFIFYDSHPGFRWGRPGERIREKQCFSFTNSTSLVVDRPMRTGCTTFMRMPRILVTPYKPNTPLAGARRVVLLDPLSLADRAHLLYFRASCHLMKTENHGKSFRWYLSEHVFANSRTPEVDVSCTNRELGGQHATFTDMFDDMRNSTFCLALPGDSSSTRRLSEIMLANCIPVFAGPPYHSMPFHHTVNWSAAGVFFNISNYSPWMDGKFSWHLASDKFPRSPNDGLWWGPDAHVEGFIQISQATEVGCPGYTLMCLHLQCAYQQCDKHKCMECRCSFIYSNCQRLR